MIRWRSTPAPSIRDVLVAAAAAGLGSGAPSTAWALARRQDPLESSRAAGRILLPRGRSTLGQLAAGAAVHSVLSLGWAAAIARLPTTRRPLLTGATAGLAIAALDLGVLGRRIPAIAALDWRPQLADHVAFGLLAGAALSRARRRSAPIG